MARAAMDADRSGRIELRTSSREKAILAQAATLKNMDLTSFLIRTALPVAQDIVDQAERIALSERDSLRVLDLLENPPPANAQLLAAVRSMRRNRLAHP